MSSNNNPNYDSLELSLLDSVANSELSDIGTDIAEFGVDAALDPGVLESLPVVGVLKKLHNLAKSVQNRLFLRKLLRFLMEFDNVPFEDRQKQILKLLDNQEESKRVGESLLFLIARINHVDKPMMVARAFKAYLQESISPQQFESLTHAIDAVDVSALPTLLEIYEKPINYGKQVSFDADGHGYEQHLAICGLLSIIFVESGDEVIGGAVTGLTKNKLGRLFTSVILGGHPADR